MPNILLVNNSELLSTNNTENIGAQNSTTLSSQQWSYTMQPILGMQELQKVVDKKSQSIEEFNIYLTRKKENIQQNIVLESIKHFINRAICDPIVGDAALRNILIDVSKSVHRAVNIDFEEDRTQTKESTTVKIDQSFNNDDDDNDADEKGNANDNKKKRKVSNQKITTIGHSTMEFFTLLCGGKKWAASTILYLAEIIGKQP